MKIINADVEFITPIEEWYREEGGKTDA